MKQLPISMGILILVAIAITVGCTRDQEAVRTAAAAQDPPVQAPRFETFVIPDGTTVVASLDTRLSTKTSRAGDHFGATTTEPIIVNGKTAIAPGARIHGVLRDVQASGRIEGRAQMTLAYQDIVDAEGKTYMISAQPLALQAASATHGDIEKIAAGGVIGAIVGGITAGGKGAAIGAGAGAGAGTALMLATKGDEVEIEAGQRLNIRMTSPVTVRLLAQK